MNKDIQEYFAGGLISSPIQNFPYPQRWCRFCERELDIASAIHVRNEPLIFKCLFVCNNEKCGAYDEESHSQYTLIYYPSEEARKLSDWHGAGFDSFKIKQVDGKNITI